MNKQIFPTLILSVLVLFALPMAASANDDIEIRELFSRWQKAFAAKNITDLMSCYAPGNRVVAFDIVPPLARLGRDAYRKNFEDFFATYQGQLEIEIRDLNIQASGDVAFLTCLERTTGVIKGGQKSETWCRSTSGLRKIDGRWLIVHDHVSFPVDVESGKALMELKP